MSLPQDNNNNNNNKEEDEDIIIIQFTISVKKSAKKKYSCVEYLIKENIIIINLEIFNYRYFAAGFNYKHLNKLVCLVFPDFLETLFLFINSIKKTRRDYYN